MGSSMEIIQKTKTVLKATIVLAVALAFIMPGATAVTNSTKQVNPVGVPQNAIRRDFTAITAQSLLHAASAGDDIDLTGWNPGDDRLPRIHETSEGYPFVTWTNEADVLTSNLGYAYATDPTSQDDWQTHAVIIQLTGATQLRYGDTARYAHDDLQMFGVFMVFDSGLEATGAVNIPDISDFNTWSFYTWNGGAPEPVGTCVDDNSYYHVVVPSETYDVWGPYNLNIYHEIYTTYDIPGCPIAFHTDIIGQAGIGFFDAQSHQKTAPASDPDMACLNNSFHTVIQYNNPSGPAQLVWKKMVPTEEPDYEYTPYQQTLVDGTHPAIAAFVSGANTNVAIVYMDAGAVKCVYSSDDGATWQAPTTVAVAGTYPSICVKDGKFLASYINEGNLFTVESATGATWGTPTQINDQAGTVVAEENAVDLDPLGITWVDNRGADLDVYFQALGLVQLLPKLEIVSYAGGIQGASAVITNSGQADATNVAWTITVTGGILGRINKTISGTLTSLAIGANATIGPTGMILGLGTIQVNVNAVCAEGPSVSGSKTGKQFFIITKI
jgi:hypothetical protein